MATQDIMSGSLEEGLVLERRIRIDETRVITFMGDELRVYETPSMISDMEYACRDLLVENLPVGWDSVGVVVDIEHLAATPMNEWVNLRVEIEQIDGRRVQFRCEVRDAVELAGRGRHDRFIVDIEIHRKRVLDKRAYFQILRDA